MRLSSIKILIFVFEKKKYFFLKYIGSMVTLPKTAYSDHY
ncbi:hypothetical protein M141_0164 [Bacteroides fragilis str. S38L5]|nr:hypothetical protein M141_0164 [Bacteroides fragilis str. S38L5]EYB16280.1 hypothetical protein M140_0112 [Bacteroides fragilis str. S38L3]